MNKYDDTSMVRKNHIHFRVTDREMKLIKEYQKKIRAPSVGQVARDLIMAGLEFKMCAKCVQNVCAFEEKKKEMKEKNQKKDKEIKKEFCLGDFTKIADEVDTSTSKKKLNSLSLEERKNAFWNRLAPFIDNGQYPRQMVLDFFSYWTESNVSGRRMRFEMEKTYELPRRLATWKRNEQRRQFTGRRNVTTTLTPDEQMAQMRAIKERQKDSEELLKKYDSYREAAISFEEFKRTSLTNKNNANK